ncbi:alanine racemase [Planococcus lenghuensis]|uniref:Alanine racemase n=1 Tax=Planococcus lenghuensis TaxID=2213202 RepID=A0A1Q2KVD1_9BACL|nr:alanine racemase [Planococcus lenghuensis]AQQ52139.1 alanine racemase [Planococcus lenghuensis]
MGKLYRPTRAIIELDAIAHNLAIIKKAAGDVRMIAVVKANGYGHGAEAVARQALKSGAALLAVATPDEALELRGQGIDADILVMGASPVSFIPVAVEHNVILTAYSADWVRQARNAASGDVRIHLKVDTGMGRLGIQPEETEEVLAMLRRSPFHLEGVFTHFATADEADSDLLNRQGERFTAVLKHTGTGLLIHAANSAAALLHPEFAFNAVRAGIAMYGIAPSAYVESELKSPLKPAMSLSTELVHVKKLPAGSTVSYGATYVTEKDEWIGTLPIGYADGLLRGLQGQEVLIRGKRVPIIGRICMDQCMVRLQQEMPAGEPVQLLGVQGGEQIRAEEWARCLETIPYEIPCMLTARVPRFLR